MAITDFLKKLFGGGGEPATPRADGGAARSDTAMEATEAAAAAATPLTAAAPVAPMAAAAIAEADAPADGEPEEQSADERPSTS